MKLLKVLIVVVAICLIGLSGCSDDDPIVVQEQGPTADDLVGTYNSECWFVETADTTPDTWNDATTTYTTTGRASIWTIYAFETTADPPVALDPCSSPWWVIETSQDYTIQGQNTDLNVTEIDYTMKTVTLKIVDEAAVLGFNLVAVCGYTDWVVDVAKDIMGDTCEGDYTSDVGEIDKEVLQLDSEAVPVTLLVGDINDPDEERLTTLQPVVYTKQ